MPDRRDVESVATSQYDSADDREPDEVLSVFLGLFVGALLVVPFALALWVLS
jgi:hypothetical protein